MFELILKETWRKEVAADGGEQVLEFGAADVLLMAHPEQHGLVHLRLAAHVELVALDDLYQLTGRQVHELLLLAHRAEVLVHVLTCFLVQVVATVHVRKVGDADAVGRVELVLEEGAAGLDHMGHLQHAGGWQQGAHVHLTHMDFRRVGELDKRRQHARLDALQRDVAHFALLHTRRAEHSLEVGTGSRKDQFVGSVCLRLGVQGHVAQLACMPQVVHHLEGFLWVLHNSEVHAAIKGPVSRHWFGSVTPRTTTSAASRGSRHW